MEQRQPAEAGGGRGHGGETAAAERGGAARAGAGGRGGRERCGGAGRTLGCHEGTRVEDPWGTHGSWKAARDTGEAGSKDAPRGAVSPVGLEAPGGVGSGCAVLSPVGLGSGWAPPEAPPGVEKEQEILPGGGGGCGVKVPECGPWQASPCLPYQHVPVGTLILPFPRGTPKISSRQQLTELCFRDPPSSAETSPGPRSRDGKV